MMRRILFILSFFSIFFAANSQGPPSGCPEILDQQLTAFNFGTAGADQWQSFTAGLNGRLTKIDIKTNGCATYSYQLIVYAGTGTVGAVLYSGLYNNPGLCNNWLASNLGTTTGPIVSSGNVYTFRILSSVNPSFVVDSSNAYPGGTYYSNFYGPVPKYDLLMRTWVQSLAVPNVSISPTGPLSTCLGGSVNLIASSGTYSYQWFTSAGPIPGATSITYSAASGNSFAAIVTNTVNNCFNTSNSLSITALPPPITNNSITLCRGSTATLTSLSAGTFTWSTGANTPSITVSPQNSTQYTVNANNLNGCRVTTITNVNINPTPVLNINGLTATVNLGSCSTNNSSWSTTYFTFADPLPPNARITGYTFDFDAVDQGWGGTGCFLSTQISGDPAGGTNISNAIQNYTYFIQSSAPSYTYGGINSLGLSFCGWGGWQAFTYNTKVIIHYDLSSIPVCQGNSLTLTATGATSFSWSSGLSNGVPFTPPSGNPVYTVTGSFPTGCTASRQVTITNNPLPNLSVVGPSTLCAGNIATLSVSGANTYTWSGGSNGSTFTLLPVASSSFIVSGTNTLTGCTGTFSNAVNAIPLPTVAVGNYSMCFGDSLNIVPAGADFYTFLNGSAVVSPSATTAYSIVGTSSAGCVSANTAIAAVTVYSLPIVSVPGGTICSGQTFSLNPTGAVSYVFINGGPVVSPTVTETYSVAGTSSDGCVSQPVALATVTVFNTPIITATSGSICSGGVFTMQAFGASTYTFSSGSATVAPVSTSVYSISGTDSLGCVSISDGTCVVTVETTPTITVSSGTICAGQSYTFSYSGAATYTYSGGTAIVSPPTSTVFQVSGFSPAGCESAAISATVTVNQLPEIIAAFIPSVPCVGDSILPNATGALTLTWSGGLINGIKVALPPTPQQYTVSGVDSNGCANSTITTLVSSPLPKITINSSNEIACEAASIVLSALGAQTYTWQNGSIGSSATFSPITITTYTVRGTDLFGCSNSSSYTQSVIACPKNFTAYATVTDVECLKKNNGKIAAFASADYDQKIISYQWSNGLCPTDTCAVVENLAAGIYKVKVLLTYTLNNTLVKKDSLQLGPFSVDDLNGPCNINVFNGISINSENGNERFYIKNIEMYPKNKVTVFNRWGQLIKEINGYDNKELVWPGSSELENLQPTTYFYIIDLADGSAPIKGWIELIKR